MSEKIKEQMKEDFKTELANGSNLERIRDSNGEWVDGYLPVYYNQIVQEWQQMPSEYNDRGHAELGGEITIYNLMSLDLYLYYSDIFNDAIRELEEELEQE
jgi:hypothetical protein